MPVRTTFVTLCVLALAACSPAATSSPDAGGADVAQIVGTWTGTSTITSGTRSGSMVATVHIATNSLGVVTLDICPDLSPVSATVESPTKFSLVVPITCPAGTVGGCSSAALTYTSGGGNIGAAPSDGGPSDAGGAPGTLNFTAAGTLAGCQSSSPVTVSFTGTRM